MKVTVSIDYKNYGENREFKNEKEAIKYLKYLLRRV